MADHRTSKGYTNHLIWRPDKKTKMISKAPPVKQLLWQDNNNQFQRIEFCKFLCGDGNSLKFGIIDF